MKYIKLFENFDPKSEREITSPKVISKLAEISNYLQSTDVYGLSIQGNLSDPPSGWTCNQWPINLQLQYYYDSSKVAECFIHFNCDLNVPGYHEKNPHILINKNTKFREYKEDVYINKGLTGRPSTLKKGLYLYNDPNEGAEYIHPIISQACGIDPKLNELVKDLITCIKEEELIPWTDSLIEK